MRITAGNNIYKKLAVQCLNEALCFVSCSVVADSLVLRNRQLLVASKPLAVIVKDDRVKNKILTIMIRTVSQKMGVKENSRAFFINADNETLDNINLPAIDISPKLEDDFDYIHLFVKTQAEFIEHFPKLKPHLKSTGMLWISWPKGGKLGTDLNIKSVIKLGYDFGLVESTCLSINDIWSGLKFTHPKKGKVYNNSYGKLNQDKTTNR
jgi:hypothetical protein